MVSNLSSFQIPREQLEAKVKWYEKKYGPVIQKRGLNNWKNLFRKPNLYEWLILAMLLMALFMAWAYTHDIEATKINTYRICNYNYDLGPAIDEEQQLNSLDIRGFDEGVLGYDTG